MVRELRVKAVTPCCHVVAPFASFHRRACRAILLDHHRGIIPRAMQYIFRHVEHAATSAVYIVKVSYLELYKEKVFDLLRFGEDSKSRSGPGLDVYHKVRYTQRPLPIPCCLAYAWLRGGRGGGGGGAACVCARARLWCTII